VIDAGVGAGFDIVGGGAGAGARPAGADPRKTLFSGVGKSEAEIHLALAKDIACLNVESEAELERVASIARRATKPAPIALRVNPDIDARTHPYISTGLRENKFGIAYAEAERLYLRAARMPELEVVGIGCHIGSLLGDAAPFIAAAQKIVALVDRLEAAGIQLRHIDVGGGIGIRYKDETPEPIAAFVHGTIEALGERHHTVVFDPGRAIVGNAGVLLTRIEYIKPGEARNFLVVDAAMNDLIRPPLYDAWHDVRTVREGYGHAAEAVYDVVGPICESADFLARQRRLAAAPGALLAILSAGAYGMSMSSNYNSRPRAAEVLVAGSEARLVRRRESVDELFRAEQLPD
jgi:diaminopimelate decarboxylase